MRTRVNASFFFAILTSSMMLGHISLAHAASAGTVQMASSSYSVAETSAAVTVTVTRTGGTSGQAWVNYGTKSGTAVYGTNYAHTAGTLYWPSGDGSSKTVTIKLVQQAGFTGTKSFALTLSSPTNAILGTPASATISLVAASTSSTLALSAASYSVASTGGSVKVNVKRTGSNGASSVHYATASGTATAGINFINNSGTLSWASGDASVKTVTIGVANVSSTVASKTFSISLSTPSGAALASPTSATVTITYTVTSGSGTGAAAKLAVKLGKPSRLLVGMGVQGSSGGVSEALSQGVKVDIYDAYLGSGDWTAWNAPPCDYACVIADRANSLNAVPMFTQYQMANWGEDNMGALTDASFMSTYWANLKLLYQDIATYNKPALVNLEPDFWGFVEQNNADPTKVSALVTSNADCSTLGNNVAGIAACMIKMARKYAPKAYLGFPPSTWGGANDAAVVKFMNALGAQNGDFIVEQTLDRDPGCFERSPQPSYCVRNSAGLYLDETNQTHPNFEDYLSSVKTYHTGIGGLPVIWWQTPMGVPSSSKGGTDYHYRSNYEHYFLTHPTELTAVGGLAAVFSTGESHQTSISTDGGQFQKLSGDYLAAPAKLP